MKKYKQLVRELPSKTVVFTFGRFNPPTIGHELLIKVVRKLSSQYKADHIIFASASQDSKKNPLDVTKKVQYLELLFPNTRFIAASPQTRTFLEAAVQLNKKYRNLVMVAGSDRVEEFKKILNHYNGKAFKFDTIQVVSAGERDPDADDLTGMSASKMRSLASKGDYHQFKRGLPTTIRDIDGKRLMNDIRQGMGLEPIKEQLNLVKDTLREQYFRGEIFNEGDIVESNETVYKIIKRGSNHLLLLGEDGAKVSKWIQDVQPLERENMNFKDYLKESDQFTAGSSKSATATTATAERAQKMAELKAKQAKQTADLKNRQDREAQQARDAIKSEAVLSPSDYRKVKVIDAEKETESDIDASAHATTSPDHTHVGGQHMAAGENHSLRRMRARYHMGEETEEQQGTRKAQLKRFKDQAAEAKLGIGEGYYMGKQRSAAWHADGGANDEGYGNEPHKPRSVMDRPHTVHIGGKPWKKFPNGHQAHAAAKTLQAKGKDAVATAHYSEETVHEAAYAGLEKEDKPGKKKTAFGGSHNAVEGETVEGWKDEKKPVAEEFQFEELDVAQLEQDVDNLTEDEMLEAYDDAELAFVDEETGEEIEAVAEEAQFDTPMIMEILSRAERLKSKARIRRSQTKRTRAEKVAIRRFSTPEVANNRARRLTISLIKKRMLKGKNLSKASIGEKEAIERFIAQRKKVVDRLSARMVPRVRATEKRRLSHGKFTKAQKHQGIAI